MKKNRKGHYSTNSAYGYSNPNKTKRKNKTVFIIAGLTLLLIGSGTLFGVQVMETKNLTSIINKWNEPNISSVTGEEKQKSDWESKIKEVSNSASVSSDKYVLLLDYMMNYKASDRDIKKFTSDILNDYQNGPFLKAVDNDEQMLTNMFKSYIVSEYTSADTNYELKAFAYNYQQALSYVYRELEAVNSEFVNGKVKVMDKELPKLIVDDK